ncbi:MAG TPA: phosphate signaling complex protein PhoU [Dehalococcoidia bacterium]|jgi:phosphate transport system protein|nr:phosphate signaling complex protein PhoU [Dehalococcoidia bacterium]
MPRTLYENELRSIQDQVLLLGNMAEHAIERSVQALTHSDLALARAVIEGDQEINRKRFSIEEGCIHVMATQQPIATDLRILVAVLNIITDLERMADHAEGIARITLLMVGEPCGEDFGHIPEMAVKAQTMLRDSLTAFINRDVDAAHAICNRDDEIDALYDMVYATAINRMVQNPSLIAPQTYLLWTAHNLERIADRATNIAERVIFLVTGRMDELNVSRY